MKAYSLNDEDFLFYSIGDVMSALEDDDNLVVGSIYYEIETEPADLSDYIDASTMLESAEERAYEEFGECAEDAFSTTKEAFDELDYALRKWAAKHLPKGYWRCVGKSRPLTVTVEDVAEYSRPGKDGGT